MIFKFLEYCQLVIQLNSCCKISLFKLLAGVGFHNHLELHSTLTKIYRWIPDLLELLSESCLYYIKFHQDVLQFHMLSQYWLACGSESNPAFSTLWNSIFQGLHVVSWRVISSCCHQLPLTASVSFCVAQPPTPLLPTTTITLLPLNLSTEACGWLRPPLLWAGDTAGGQGSGSSLKKSRQIKDKTYWGRKK